MYMTMQVDYIFARSLVLTQRSGQNCNSKMGYLRVTGTKHEYCPLLVTRRGQYS